MKPTDQTTPQFQQNSSTVLRAAALLACLAVASCATSPGKLAQPMRPASTFNVPGLERPAEVLIDRWGVPHLYAGTMYDAFVAQGFMAARDRLWQMD